MAIVYFASTIIFDPNFYFLKHIFVSHLCINNFFERKRLFTTLILLLLSKWRELGHSIATALLLIAIWRKRKWSHFTTVLLAKWGWRRSESVVVAMTIFTHWATKWSTTLWAFRERRFTRVGSIKWRRLST